MEKIFKCINNVKITILLKILSGSLHGNLLFLEDQAQICLDGSKNMYVFGPAVENIEQF